MGTKDKPNVELLAVTKVCSAGAIYHVKYPGGLLRWEVVRFEHNCNRTLGTYEFPDEAERAYSVLVVGGGEVAPSATVHEHTKAAIEWLESQGFVCQPGYGALRSDGDKVVERAFVTVSDGKALVQRYGR